MGYPTVFPTGVTIYDRKKAYNGYTVYPSAKGALLIDMNGNEVQLWSGLSGFPNKILPGGYVMGSTGARAGKYAFQDQLDLVQVDWNGNIVWKFDHLEFIDDPGSEPRYVARQHHDFEREGSSTGYYAPGAEPLTDHGNTLILTHINCYNHAISDKRLLDDQIIEVDWDGNILWKWRASDHFEEFGFDEAARNVLFRNPSLREAGGGVGDWLHINCISTLGPNRWYDAGDKRFHPDNILFDARNANILAIISKKTGKFVWRLGPDFAHDEKARKLGWIIGQHHFHMIPRGLPGEGDLLVYDNGGAAGYGVPNPASPAGLNNAVRSYSRVLQFNPITLDITWQYTPEDAGSLLFADSYKFFSPYISSAQRLPNGNTLITEGSDGRVFEVTPEHEIVWEYINPYYNTVAGKYRNNLVYRAYRVPYEWIPQLEKPQETSVAPIDISSFRVPGAASGTESGRVTTVEGVAASSTLSTGSGAKGPDDDSEVINFCVGSVKNDKKH
ncbi:MAG: aryl-sulfate sulfotransferase [Oscillospiraceae bacterium]|jgi:hypothetical protein|nr:aryl-sulfate sulfotransferase [Oscillospiraceae bacterium]